MKIKRAVLLRTTAGVAAAAALASAVAFTAAPAEASTPANLELCNALNSGQAIDAWTSGGTFLGKVFQGNCGPISGATTGEEVQVFLDNADPAYLLADLFLNGDIVNQCGLTLIGDLPDFTYNATGDCTGEVFNS